MKRKGDNLLAEILKTTKFYYFNVLPTLVREAISPGEENTSFGETGFYQKN